MKYFFPIVYEFGTGNEGVVLQNESKKTTYTSLDFDRSASSEKALDQKFSNFRERLNNHQTFFSNEIGYYIKKGLPANKYIVSAIIITTSAFIVKSEVKATLERAGFEDQEFKPVWVGKNLDSEPPFWLWYHTGKRLNYDLDSKLGEDKWYLPAEIKSSLRDLNRVFKYDHHYNISPRILSEKVVEVLRPFKIKFEPVEFVE